MIRGVRVTTMGGGPRRAALALLMVAAGVAAFEVTKAVHVDDTAHLEIARAILRSPLHPMSGLVNWEQRAAPIHNLNQPHLLFYLMGAVMVLVPAHAELALHLLWAMLAGAAVVLFYQVARAAAARRPLLWTAVFCLGPAFLPASNLMVDVPLLALWLGFFLAVARAQGDATVSRLVTAGLFAAAACLVKYTSLVLIPIFALAILRRHGPRALGLLLIPVVALAGWSVFNWLDYGGVHLLTRSIPAARSSALRSLEVILARFALWLIGLGSVASFSPAFAGVLARDRSGRRLLGLAVLVAAITTAVGRLALAHEPLIQSVLRGVFLANGVVVCEMARRAARAAGDAGPGASGRWWLEAWAVGACLFVVMLSPFIAVRHVMLAVPALLLLIARGPDAALLSRRARAAALALSVVGGVALAVSDAELADVYRQQAPALASRFCASARCVAVGHSGWQWYAERAGMEIYDDRRTSLAPGQRVIIPELVGRQELRPDQKARLRPIATIEIPASPLTLIRTMATEHSGPQGDRAGGYYYFWTSVPWTITTRPLDRFRILEVAAGAAPPAPAR